MIRSMLRSESGMSGFSLVGILVSVGIIIAAAVYLIPAYTGGGSGSLAKTAPPGKAATPIQRAESVECRSNLTQIRQAITMYNTSNERVPANLQELSTYGVSASLMYCPVGGSGYTYGYDPQSGRVACRYAGHERY
jgi:type II secretory pathway pseudopilin PulG